MLRSVCVKSVKAKKLDVVCAGVNLTLSCILSMGLAGCAPSAGPLPAVVQPAVWPMLLATPARAPFAAEAVGDSVVIVWRHSLGRGLSSPLAIAGPMLLAGTANRVAIAIASDGGHYWLHRVEGSLTGGVVASGERVFFNAEEHGGKAFALDVRTGQKLWSRTVGPSPHAPLVVGDTVYFINDTGGLRALGAREGTPYWEAQLGGAAATTPTPYRDALIVATRTDTLYMVSRDRGRVVAKLALPAGASAAPALSGDTLLQPLHSGTLLVIALPALTLARRIELGAPLLAAPVIAGDGSIYQLTSAADVFRMRGAGANAQRIAQLGGAASGSLTLVKNGLLVGKLDGTLVFLRVDGTQVWRRDLRGEIVAPSTVMDGAIYAPLMNGTLVKLK
jgi:outer membrane protein assembly factor BamB